MNTIFTEEQIKEAQRKMRSEYARQWRKNNSHYYREYIREYQKRYIRTPEGGAASRRAKENYWRRRAIKELEAQNKENI